MIGTQIDNYRITEKIGDGGMGSVYKAVDVMLEREVALKFLRPELASQPDLVDRFRSEAIVLARLSHPNIAALYGLHKHGDDFFMAMEYVRGETLDVTIREQKQIPIAQAAEVASTVLGALEYAHSQGIVHRDIKSANIILGASGCKVMDFGIARVLGTDRRTRVGFVVGTIGYMAPEQIQGMDVDGRADIYALGVVLYEMITGRVPFEGESEWAIMQAQVQQMPVPPRVFASHIPVSLENVVMRALAKQPQDRFQTAREFQRAIQVALRQSGIHQTTSFVAAPAEDSLIAAPLDETREHKSNPQLVSGQVLAYGSGAIVPPGAVKSAPANKPAAPASGGNGLAMAVWAVVAVILVGGAAFGWWFWKARMNAVPAEVAATVDAGTGPALPDIPAAPAPPAAGTIDVPGLPAPAGVPARGTAVAGKPAAPLPTATAKPAPPKVAGGTATPSASPEVAPPVAAPSGAALPPAVFGGVRVVTRPGRRPQETSAVLELRDDALRLRPLRRPERLVPYTSISGAWFGTLRIDRLVGDDVHHLLFLDAGGERLVLRLDKANYRAILPALEARSGLKIADRGDITLDDVER